MHKLPLAPDVPIGSVFNHPWEALAFGLVLALHKQGAFSWPEWSTTLAEVISNAQTKGETDLGDTYYQHWLQALEIIVEEKALTDSKELSTRVEQWRNAYLSTPHGKPVELISK